MTDFDPLDAPLPEPPQKRGKPRRRKMSEEERAWRTSPEWKEHLRTVGFQKRQGKDWWP